MSLEVQLVAPYRHGVFSASVGNSATVLFTPPLNSKSRVAKIVAYNADSVAHTLVLVAYNPATGTTTQMLPAIPLAAGSFTVLEESQLPDVYLYQVAGQQPQSWAAYVTGSVSTAGVQVAVEFAVE